jgi:hypothetical protein
MPYHAAPPAPPVAFVQQAVYSHGKFVRWESILCTPNGCRLVVKTKPVVVISRTAPPTRSVFPATAVPTNAISQDDRGGFAG